MGPEGLRALGGRSGRQRLGGLRRGLVHRGEVARGGALVPVFGGEGVLDGVVLGAGGVLGTRAGLVAVVGFVGLQLILRQMGRCTDKLHHVVRGLKEECSPDSNRSGPRSHGVGSTP